VYDVPPAASGKGLVSLTFDDGTSDHYSNVLPILRSNGQVGTFYVISGYLNANHYLTVDQAREIQNAGNEIGSHTVDHPHLPTLSAAKIESELADSKAALEKNFGPITDLAYPYGDNNATVRQIAAKYYTSARSTNGGLLTPGSYDRYDLTIGYVLNTTPLDTVKKWIADAQADNKWLILCYHAVSNGRPGETYNVQIPDFQAQVGAIKSSGVRVVTIRDGLKLTGN
jgi:peptidoglycan/xylan/chitin deacetylase (PgdA/CDA1 family)